VLTNYARLYLGTLAVESRFGLFNGKETDAGNFYPAFSPFLLIPLWDPPSSYPFYYAFIKMV